MTVKWFTLTLSVHVVNLVASVSLCQMQVSVSPQSQLVALWKKKKNEFTLSVKLQNRNLDVSLSTLSFDFREAASPEFSFVPLVEQNLIFPRDGHFSSVDFNQPLQLSLGFFLPVDAVFLLGSLCLGLPCRTPQLLLEARDDVLSHFRLNLLLAQQPVQLPDVILEVTELGQEVLLKDAVCWSRL